MATLKEQLAQLTDEELLALEQEILKSNTPEGIQADAERLQASGISMGGVGRGLLEGATRGGRAVVSGVRELAGMTALPEPGTGDLETFRRKEEIKSELEEGRTKRLLGGDLQGAEDTFRAKGFTSGGVSFEREVTEDEKKAKREEDLEILKAKEEVKKGVATATKKVAGERQARISLSVIGGSAQRLGQRYADGYEEGGIGDLAKSLLSSGAQKLGGKAGDKFKHSGAFPGQKVELITKLMPILTQQGDKPGSVRLVSTVFDKLMGTLPSKATGPETAKEMISATLKNMFTFANAIKSLGITNEEIEGMSDEELEQLGNRIEGFADELKLSPEEQQDLDSLLSVALEPLTKLISEQRGATGIQPTTETTPQEEQTATNPQTGEKIILRNGQWQTQ